MKLQKTSTVLAALTLAACSGGARSLPPATDGAAAITKVAVPAATGSKSQTAKVTFVVNWPKAKSDRRHLHSRFVSPSAMSAILQVGSGKSAIIGIANNDGAASSQLELEVPVGSGDFTVSLYDHKQTSSTSIAGLLLGQGEVVQTIKANQVNRLHIVVDGVVANVGVALDPHSTMAEVSGSSGSQRLTLVGDVPAIVVLTPLDVDGNAIVAPGTVPPVSLKSGLETSTGLSVTPVPGKRGEFIVAAAGPSSNGTYGLVATAKDGQGGTAQTNLAVVQSSAMYVAYGNGNGARIAIFDETGHVMPMPANAFAGVTQPVGLSYDADDRLLFVADASGKLLAFDGAGNPSSVFAPHIVPGINSVSYFNAQNARYPQYQIVSPKRVIVGGSSGITEFDATTGAQLVQASLSFTPTAVTGLLDNVGYATSGWLVMVGDPAGSVDPYDLVTLAPYAGDIISMNGETASGFGTYLMPQSRQYSGDYCISDKSIALSIAQGSSCLYTVTGSASEIVRLGNVQFGTPFGQLGVAGSFDQRKTSGTLSAIAVDQLNSELDVTKSDSNTIGEFDVTDVYAFASSTDKFKLVQRASFATPPSLGYSSPNAIAVEW